MKHAALPLVGKVMDLLLDAVCVVDREGRFVFISAACERIFGYPPEQMLGRPMIDFVLPEDRQRTLQAAAEVMQGEPKAHFRNRYLRKDGEVVHIMWSARWSEADQVRIALARDVTELARAESQQAAVYAISEAAHAATDLYSLFRRIHEIVLGLWPGTELWVALAGDDGGPTAFPYRSGNAALDRHARQVCQTLIDAGAVAAADLGPDPEHWLGAPLRSQSGAIGALLLHSAPELRGYSGTDRELLQYVSVQIAIAIERKRAELHMQHLALHDNLTDLPNRQLFHDRLRHALRRSCRHGVRAALLCLDLDGFKQVNDRHGHLVGDQLLRAVAARLRGCVRESDTVARVGGDEFMVVLDGIDEIAHACGVADKIVASLVQPLAIGDLQLQVSSSVGVALHPDHGDDAISLMRCADAAMYAAKLEGKNRARLGQRLTPATADDSLRV